jgi:phosphonate transport system permease protein
MTWSELTLDRYRAGAKSAAVLAVLVILAAWVCEVSPASFVDGIGKGLGVLALFFPPDWASLPDMIQPAAVTLLVAAVATPIGAAISLVFGLCAAKNIAPPWLRTVSRGLIALERGIPEIVLLLILVAAFGIGPFAGIMALSVGSIGMLGKLMGDAVEEIDPRVTESVTAVGASHGQVIRYAILPQITPALLAQTLFRFEVNIRASVLLGAVGGGGIGYELMTAMSQLEYQKATVATAVSLTLVFLSERVSDRLRARILARGQLLK